MFTIHKSGYHLTRAGYALAGLDSAHRVVENTVDPGEQRFADDDIDGYMFKALRWTGRTGLWDTRCPDCTRDSYLHESLCPTATQVQS